MSEILINGYLAEIHRLRTVSGRTTEQIVREAFKDLLKDWSKARSLSFVAELEYQTAFKTKVYPDGTVLYDLRVPLGFWEAKDTGDDLGAEITKKFAKGYPKDNILFEDTATAVLWQDGREALRCGMTDVKALNRLVSLFFAWERPEIAEFRQAVEQFKADLPNVLEALRAKIDEAYAGNAGFQAAAGAFLTHARETINPTLGEADVREMLIQHILTEEIFAHVFNEADFHRDNNIARELYALEGAFFTGGVKRDTLRGLEPYYAAIRKNAAQISTHREKQTFLKVIYENFYKVYNPKAADRLGVVYTSHEIVRFMVEGADWLCHKHFGRTLIDRDVEILDPATGTGTFICELIEHFRGQPAKLAHKYREELHANEVAILPYYVANLNIEATYAAAAGGYEEFKNLCFVDTLDNVAGLGIKAGQQGDLFAALSDENIERVKRQNKRKISVVIGNPPYNANQQNENDNNKNRAYPHIDGLIKQSFVKLSTAQKTKVYDMYARFFRWAADRLHDDGVIAFVTNRSFIDSRTFDGFRRYVAQEFAEVYLVDLGGDVRADPRISGTKHNVFGIQTGVAISLLVKKGGVKGCRIRYVRRPELDTAEEKLAWLGANPASGLRYERVEPDARANWINQNENDWDELIPVADKKTKAAKIARQERAIFKLYSLGISSNRDDWVYGFSEENVAEKIGFLLEHYRTEKDRWASSGGKRDDVGDFLDKSIKWTADLQQSLIRGELFDLDRERVFESSYRPFVKRFAYFAPTITHRMYQNGAYFPTRHDANAVILASNFRRAPYGIHASKYLPNTDYFVPDVATGLARYRYTASGERIDNITDWALNRFRDRYGKGVSKDAIFHYVYAALHDPVWRVTYAINLRREFPRLPFHANFGRWAAWGERLMALHVGYETVEPWPLVRTDMPDLKARAGGVAPRVILRAEKAAGRVVIDSETVLDGLPEEAWVYRLGNRSGVEWILDQYKEKKPRDLTIREKFNTYRFADYKEHVADLIARVVRVSVETMEIVEVMRGMRGA